MDKDKEFLGTEKIGKLLFRLAVPTVIAQIVNMLYNIVDRIYIGHIPGEGSAALTGVGVCMPIIMIISAFAALVSAGGAPRASISLGKGDKDGAEKILGGCFLLQLILSVVLTAVLLIWDRKLLLMFGASENTIDYATAYMDIYAVGTIFVQLTLGLNAFITAQGFAKTGMLTVIIGAAAKSAVPALSLLKGAGVQQVILSASNLPVLEQQVTERGVRPYFDRLLGLDNIYARSKVEVGLAYLTELKQRGAVPAQAIMIGDSVHDFEVAQALGVRCVLQTAGHQSAQQLRATGAPVVPDVLAAAQYCLNEL